MFGEGGGSRCRLQHRTFGSALGSTPGWSFGPDNPNANVTALRERVLSELGWRFEEYNPNDPDEGTDYHMIFVGKVCISLLASKGGIVAGIGADWRDIPLLLRIAELYAAERRGWRWSLYWLWQRVAGRRPDADPGILRWL